MINPKFIATVEQGQLIFENNIKYQEYLRSLERQKVEVVVKKWSEKNQRSIQQNKYYWGVVLKLLSDHTGHTVDELHEILKSIFLKKRIELETKTGIIPQMIYNSTTDLDTVKMENYLSNIREWSSVTLGVYVPLPNEVDFES